MDQVGALEPGRLEVLGTKSVRGAAVGDERALAAGADEDPDPAGRRTGDASSPDRDAVGLAIARRARRPAASRPTAVTSVVRDPSRASQRAVFAAEPP